MTPDPTKTNHAAEDIDLLRLLERFISFTKKFKWLFLFAIVAGLLAGFLFYKSIAKTYRSQLVLHSFLLTNAEQMQIAGNWNKLLTQKEYETLATVLHTTTDLLQHVKQIKPREIQQSFAPANPNGFTLDVLVTDNIVLDSLQKAILYGFENSSYVKERLEFKKESLRELISKTKTEIERLDSTKRVLNGLLQGNRQSSSNIILDGGNINRQIIEMNEKLSGFEEALQFTSAVQVLQGFSKYKKPHGPHLLPWLFIGFLVFICLAWAAALIISVSNKLMLRRKAATRH